jgi:hypothetical protein
VNWTGSLFNFRHTPRMRGIQYAAASRLNYKRKLQSPRAGRFPGDKFKASIRFTLLIPGRAGDIHGSYWLKIID